MNTRWLEYFVRVAEHGSLSQAAIVLGVDQASISRAIRDLETSLGATLLYRDGRGAKVTEVGLRVLESAKSVLQAVGSLETDARELETSQFRGAVIGLLPTAIRIL